jgi:hypothetical protein
VGSFGQMARRWPHLPSRVRLAKMPSLISSPWVRLAKMAWRRPHLLLGSFGQNAVADQHSLGSVRFGSVCKNACRRSPHPPTTLDGKDCAPVRRTANLSLQGQRSGGKSS